MPFYLGWIVLFLITIRECIHSNFRKIYRSYQKTALILVNMCVHIFKYYFSTSPIGAENHLASFRFQNTFRLNVWNRDVDKWFSNPDGEVLD